MRTTLTFIIIATCLVGCKRVSDEFEVSELDYNGHSYVVFESEYGGISAVHNPNCTCYVEPNI